jgi:hypothetical protein
LILAKIAPRGWALRSIIAYFFYVPARICFLLSALISTIGEQLSKIAHRIDGPALTYRQKGAVWFAGMIVVLVFIGQGAMRAEHVDMAQLTPQPAPIYTAIPNFTPEQLSWARDTAKLNGCFVAQRAVRHHLRPDPVSFEPCHQPTIIKTLNAELTELNVTGEATVFGQQRPFRVTLAHNPVSVSESGFTVTAIEVR